MSRQEDQFQEEMLQGTVRQPGWIDQASYPTNRLPAPQAYSSYSTYDQATQVTHDNIYNASTHPNVLTSAPHQSTQSQISSTWPSTYPGTTSYGHNAYPRHDDTGASSAAPLPVSTSRVTPTTSRTPRAGPRKTLTDEDRREICLYHRQHPDKKQTEIGEVFGVERSTISKILRQKEKYLGEEGGPLSRLAAQVDQPLLTWALERERSGARLTQDQLKRQARILANTRRLDEQAIAELNKPAWMDNFLRRNTNLSSFQYPNASTSSPTQQAPIPGLRPTFNNLPSLISPIPSHAVMGRSALTNTYGMPSHAAAFGGRDTFDPVMPTYGALNTTGYGYGTTGADTRPTNLYSPIDSAWGSSSRPNRNYILSSTNPDPAGPPPGPSPTSRAFDISSSSLPSIQTIGTPPIPSLYQSYRPTYATSNEMANLASASSTVQLPVMQRNWNESQTQSISVPPQGQARMSQSTYSSPSTSVALSSTSKSDSPRGMPLTTQQTPSAVTQEEDRAFSALMSLIENDPSGVSAGGQEPIRDMTVGRLLERLQPATRSRFERVSPASEDSEVSSGSRRIRREGDRQEQKRSRME